MLKNKFKLFLIATISTLSIFITNAQKVEAKVIYQKEVHYNNVLIGSHNKNNTSYNSGEIGKCLLEPEKGWNRYDDSNSKISYEGDGIWEQHNTGLDSRWGYMGTQTYSRDAGQKIKFTIQGKKIRLIEQCDFKDKSTYYNDHQIYADGKLIGSATGQRQTVNSDCTKVLTFEYEFSSYGKHNITIVHTIDSMTGNKNISYSNPVGIDAIDTDGELIDTNNPNAYQTEKVDNLFKDILQRPSDKSGLDYWTNRALNDGLATVVSGIINSDETRSHHYNNKDLVNILYKSMYGRYADQDGLNYWSNQLDKGYPINSLINQMASNPEFKKNCDKYDFKTSPVSLNDVCEKNPKTTVFIHELYDNILTRKPHTDELRDKVDRIAVRHFAPGKVVKMMFNSDEYKQRNYNNTDFVTMAFRSILGREPDKGGFDYWTNFLKDNSREELVNRFLDSPEYKTIIKSKL